MYISHFGKYKYFYEIKSKDSLNFLEDNFLSLIKKMTERTENFNF